jgi:hypothetical protein
LAAVLETTKLVYLVHKLPIPITNQLNLVAQATHPSVILDYNPRTSWLQSAHVLQQKEESYLSGCKAEAVLLGHRYD